MCHKCSLTGNAFACEHGLDCLCHECQPACESCGQQGVYGLCDRCAAAEADAHRERPVYDPEDYFAAMETGPDREALCEYEGYNDAPIGNVLPCGCHPTEGEACPLCEPVPESSDDLPF